MYRAVRASPSGLPGRGGRKDIRSAQVRAYDDRAQC